LFARALNGADPLQRKLIYRNQHSNCWIYSRRNGRWRSYRCWPNWISRHYSFSLLPRRSWFRFCKRCWRTPCTCSAFTISHSSNSRRKITKGMEGSRIRSRSW
jgi:hypothetical protein